MPQISKYVRDALREQLGALTTGLNDRLASIALAYGIDPYKIDWDPRTSQNFFFGRISPQALEQSSPFTYPLVTIDTLRSQNTNRVKFATFAGPIQAVIDVHHSWAEDSALQDFASLVDATEDAVIATLNDQNAIWPNNLLWNGNVATQRGAIVMGGYNWLQTLTFFCQFELIA